MRFDRLFALALMLLLNPAAGAQSRDEITGTMRRATAFMVERVATNGGYVWAYLPDMSRRWGEIEARRSMIWVQPPGTATMGHIFLDAYHATGDDYYYRAAQAATDALVRGQHRSGGWHYFIDFAGPASIREWYRTIGRNAWRMEEFIHYADNATFDDAGTAEAMQLLLRIYLERRDRRYRAPLDRAIDFVLNSQYPNGGWPQRWPHMRDYPAYARYITFNDDVAQENIRFLLAVYQSLGETRVRPAILRAGEVFLATQQPMPQPGWSLQHTLDLRPAGARTYEPLSLATHTTAANLRMMLQFYRLTGDRRYLARIPEAIDWLESLRLPPDPARGGRDFPTFIELGTNRARYVHRRGSNVVNGEYYWDYSPVATLGHYGAWRAIDIAALRRAYDRAIEIPPEEARRRSPLASPGLAPLPRFYVTSLDAGSDLNAQAAANPAAAVRTLNAEGWWPTPLRATSNPYIGPGPRTPPPGDFRTTHVGDSSDTSPYRTDRPVIGISTATYIANMVMLIEVL
ncbi:pectate lyase, partial [Sphingosinicella sp.]|uniref:pectate lyase n=1 Tax=Sphingosinicella sp. TaxID=1917971 RepID=UPI00403820BE